MFNKIRKIRKIIEDNKRKELLDLEKTRATKLFKEHCSVENKRICDNWRLRIEEYKKIPNFPSVDLFRAECCLMLLSQK